jgi:hypothetical protein
MLVHKRLGVGAADRIHVNRLQFAREADVTGLVGLDDHVAHPAVHGELEQIVNHFGVWCGGRHGKKRCGFRNSPCSVQQGFIATIT